MLTPSFSFFATQMGLYNTFHISYGDAGENSVRSGSFVAVASFHSTAFGNIPCNGLVVGQDL